MKKMLIRPEVHLPSLQNFKQNMGHKVTHTHQQEVLVSCWSDIWTQPDWNFPPAY